MSTTVSYKGQTLTTVDNETKVLETAGTWLEDDITITDTISVGGVSQDSNGYIVLADESEIMYTKDEAIEGAYRNDISGAYTTEARWLRPYQFMGVTALTSFTGNEVLDFVGGGTTGGNGQYVFANCTNLTSVSLAKIGNMGSGGYQFSGCTSLTDVYLPKCSTGQYQYNGCTSLVNVAILQQVTNAVNMNGNGFRGCTKLEKLDIGKCSRIYTNEFYNCSKLTTLVLRRTDAVTPLSNVNAFTGTPFASGGTGGTIYVPNSLIDTYKSASNWSTINGYGTITWKKIEDSIYEDTYVDGRSVPTT